MTHGPIPVHGQGLGTAGLIQPWIQCAVMGFSRGSHTGQIRLHLILCKMITSISGAMFSVADIVKMRDLWLLTTARK